MNSSSQSSQLSWGLQILNPEEPHTFVKPTKQIHEGHDVPHFLTSRAYGDICNFVMQLNIAMCPRRFTSSDHVETWQIDSPLKLSESVQNLQELLQSIDSIIEEAPPDTGPRRFGNISFRKWYEILESRVRSLLQTHLPKTVLDFKTTAGSNVSVLDELTPYLLGGFGSSQRLDYGTGHELSFLAFLACLWKLGGFTSKPSNDGSLERSIVIGIIEPYLRVVRRLILTYTLEPAGSHGVWGLDDHFFVPYIFGSSQYCPAILPDDAMPVEGSLPGSPETGDIAKKLVVDREREHNMYFSAVGFINDVKTGPFWEHSPILFDISGVRSGWGKINKGMIKMYNAEVLAKFPVVQHFPFGSLFSWDQDPNATPASQTIHTTSQPTNRSMHTSAHITQPSQQSTKAPWVTPSTGAAGISTVASRANAIPSYSDTNTRAPWSTKPEANTIPDGPTRAPWANKDNL